MVKSNWIYLNTLMWETMKNNTEKLKEAAELFCIAYTAEKERVFEAIIPNYEKKL